jgi:hypothetical protein
MVCSTAFSHSSRSDREHSASNTYCDPTAQAWQNEVYERLHGELRRLHDVLGVPYYYVEWRQGLGIVFGGVSASPFGL